VNTTVDSVQNAEEDFGGILKLFRREGFPLVVEEAEEEEEEEDEEDETEEE